MKNSPYKKTKCLEFPDNSEVRLFEIFMKLNKNYGATYMSYTFDRSDMVRFSFRTDSKWAYVYHNESIMGKPIIESCPLDIVSREKKNTFIIWDLYGNQSQPKTFREIMGLREDLGLMHGLTLSTYFDNHHDAIAIATEEKNTDLATNIITDNKGSSLKRSLLECRQEIISIFNKNNG